MDLDRIGWAGFSDLIAQVWIGDLAFPEAVTKYSHQHLDPLEIIGEEPWDISLTSMRSNIDPSNLVIQKSGVAHECESNTRLAFEDGAEWSVRGGVRGDNELLVDPLASDMDGGRRAPLDPAHPSTPAGVFPSSSRWMKTYIFYSDCIPYLYIFIYQSSLLMSTVSARTTQMLL